MPAQRSPTLVALIITGGALALTSALSCQDGEKPGDTLIKDEASKAGPQAYRIERPDQLIGGPGATGRVNDYMLENDQIRVIIRDVDRSVSAAMFGGHIIDADIVRPDGAEGRDQFGQLNTFINLSNSMYATDIRVLPKGELPAGYAGVEACGPLDLYDFVDMGAALSIAPAGSRVIRWDFNEILDLEACTLYLLGPGDNHVQVSTDLTNPGSRPVLTAVGDILDTGSDVELFTPNAEGTGYGKATTHYTWGGFGPQPYALSNLIGFFGRDVSYGYVTLPDDRGNPNTQEISVAGVTATVIGSTSLVGTLTHRPKEMFRIPPRSTRRYTRYFVVGDPDMAAVTDSAFELWGQDTTLVSGDVTDSATGEPIPDVRITALVNGGTSRPITQFLTDENGHYEGQLPAGRYGLIAAHGWENLESSRPGITVPMSIEVVSGQATEHDFTLDPGSFAKVTVTDGNSLDTLKHLPARISFYGTDPDPINANQMDVGDDPFRAGAVQEMMVTEAGQLVPIHPGRYDVVITRGPEYDRAFLQDINFEAGAEVDIAATLTRVIDTAGYASADLHVHAMNSPDSPIGNVPRVKSFMADGVDILVSTDHDFITDYRPIIDELGASPWLTSLPGLEMTTFAVGHYNAFPLPVDPDHRLGGALDWADNAYLPINPDTGVVVDVGQDTGLPSSRDNLSPTQFLAALELGYAGRQARQLNHARGNLQGYFTAIGLDLSALGTAEETQVDPTTLRMAGGSDLFDPDSFEAIEILNAYDDERAVTLLNDAFTLFNQGYPKTLTAVSDTHYLVKMPAGIARTWLEMGVDDTQVLHNDPEFPDLFVDAISQGHATASNGAFLKAQVQRPDQPASAKGPGETLSALTGQVEVVLNIQTPMWITYTTVGIFVNSPSRGNFDTEAFTQMNQLNARTTLTAGRDFSPEVISIETTNPEGARRREVNKTVALDLTEDSWIVVALWGGNVEMSNTDTWESLAFSSPILVEVDGDEWDAPCTPGVPCSIISKAKTSWDTARSEAPNHHTENILVLDKLIQLELAGDGVQLPN